MIVTFDPAKDAVNVAKHGVALSEAASLDWDAAYTWSDNRRDYGEHRMVGLVPLRERLFYVVFLDRGEMRRIISLRKANGREVDRYVANN
jgi:uncharacterized protein